MVNGENGGEDRGTVLAHRGLRSSKAEEARLRKRIALRILVYYANSNSDPRLLLLALKARGTLGENDPAKRSLTFSTKIAS